MTVRGNEARTLRVAHSLGLVAVAEGVEHADQAELLTDMGCQSAQGFRFARPLERGAVAELLAAATPAWSPAAPGLSCR